LCQMTDYTSMISDAGNLLLILKGAK
jgi:hypothetical protein